MRRYSGLKRLASGGCVRSCQDVDDRPDFADIFAWSGVASAIGAAFLAFVGTVVATAAAGEPSYLLAIFLTIAGATIFAAFTAFPLGLLIGYPIARSIGWSFVRACLTGLATSAILLGLWSNWDLPALLVFEPGNWKAALFLVTGPAAGGLAHRITFGKVMAEFDAG